MLIKQDITLDREDLFAKLIFHKETREVLGGQLIGKKGAVLRVDVLAAAIDKHMTIDELGMLDLCYAPPLHLHGIHLIPLEMWQNQN